VESVYVVTMRRLSRYEVIEIGWLSGIENFVCERDNLVAKNNDTTDR